MEVGITTCNFTGERQRQHISNLTTYKDVPKLKDHYLKLRMFFRTTASNRGTWWKHYSRCSRMTVLLSLRRCIHLQHPSCIPGTESLYILRLMVVDGHTTLLTNSLTPFTFGFLVLLSMYNDRMMLTPPSVWMRPPQEWVWRPWAIMESDIVTFDTSPLIEKVSSRPQDTETWSKIIFSPSAMVIASFPESPYV